jgi:hypothetical protein
LAVRQAYEAGGGKRALEFSCKCVRRMLELGSADHAETLQLLEDKLPLEEDALAGVESKRFERVDYLEKDIVRKQRRRFMILEEKVKQMQEQKALSGGQKTFDIRRL